MRRALLATALVLAISACTTPESLRFEDPVDGGVLVRVVDSGGRAVAGAEVRASVESGRGFTEAQRRSALSMYAEFLFMGELGRVDRFGTVWRTDARGETRLPAKALEQLVVVRSADRWGVARPNVAVHPDRFAVGESIDALAAYRTTKAPAPAVSNELTIVLERDESIRVTCRDRDGRPGVGAIVTVIVADSAADRGSTWWSEFVRAADGTLDVPHAQFWRALQDQGVEVSIFGGVMWSDEMWSVERFTDTSQPFPDTSLDEIAFEVSSSGFIEVRADWSSPDTMGVLRWIDAPPDPDDPDDVPELPINPSRSLPFSVPLGRHYEVFVELPGLIDARVAFDGPKRPGERVEVVLRRPQPATQITGRLIDANGAALAHHEFQAYLEHDGVRIEPEEDWLVTEDDGRFALDIASGSGGTLFIAVTGAVYSPTFSHSGSAVCASGHSELARHLSAGVVDVGDIALLAPR